MCVRVPVDFSGVLDVVVNFASKATATASLDDGTSMTSM